LLQLSYGPGARHVERMIDQRLHMFEELHCVRQFSMVIEGCFILPA
jgi:hypothetical protein